jgi:hypothetical protein
LLNRSSDHAVTNREKFPWSLTDKRLFCCIQCNQSICATKIYTLKRNDMQKLLESLQTNDSCGYRDDMWCSKYHICSGKPYLAKRRIIGPFGLYHQECWNSWDWFPGYCTKTNCTDSVQFRG